MSSSSFLSLRVLDGVDRAIAARWWQDRRAFGFSPVAEDAQMAKKAKKSARLSSSKENMMFQFILK
jgi:hypothetical protein